MRSSNPVVKNIEKNYVSGDDINVSGEAVEGRASYLGVSLKSLYFVGLIVVFAIFSARLLFSFPSVAVVGLVVSVVVVLVCGLLSSFVPSTTPVTGSLYAAGEGFMVGAISALVGAVYGGIVFAAFLATFVTFGVMMALHAAGLFRDGRKLRGFIFTALISVALMGLMFLILALIPATNYIVAAYPYIMIPVCVVMILVGCAFLLSDLNVIDNVVKTGMEKKYEWQASFGLMLSLLWLYIEFLRLFVILASLFGKKN